MKSATPSMPRPQFTLRALLVLMLAVACFFGGIRFETHWRRRERQREHEAWKLVPVFKLSREAAAWKAAKKAEQE